MPCTFCTTKVSWDAPGATEDTLGCAGPSRGCHCLPHPPAQGTVPVPARRVRPSCITRLFVVQILFLQSGWDPGPAASFAFCQGAGSDLGWGGRGPSATPRLYTIAVL